MSGIFGRFFICGVVISVFGVVTGCAQHRAPTTASDTASAAVNPALIGQFKLDSGDTVSVTVFGAESVSGKFTIDFNGNISLPLVGPVKAADSTVDELSAAVSQRLRESRVVENPQVTVDLIEPRQIFIYGEVTRSGNYPYLPGLNVLSAIATAGGFTYRADEDHVFVRRGGKSAEVDVDVSDPSTAPFPIYPGDIIRVPGRFY